MSEVDCGTDESEANAKQRYCDYGLSYEALRTKAVKALVARGVVGGNVIFHGGRYNKYHRWYWSPHFHVIGFILGGYGCRSCPKFDSRNEVTCGGCSGFEGRTRREHKQDGFVVKVAEDEYGAVGKRKTVGGTAWYQLNHATTKHGVVRFHVATWFGVCSYRKLKVKAKVKKAVCPLCQHDLEKLRYLGGKAGILACYGFDRNSCDRSDFYADLFEDGREVWVVGVREGYRDNG